MTLSEISAQKQKLAQKHTRNMKKLKYSYIFELIAAAILTLIDISTTTAKNPVLSGFIILLVLAAIVSGWNALLYFIYKRENENEIVKLNALEHRLQEKQKAAQEQQENRARVRAVQEAFISLAKSAEQNQNKHPTNCPNCGALLHSNVCDYCGTHI